jgi:hypothetical protein
MAEIVDDDDVEDHAQSTPARTLPQPNRARTGASSKPKKPAVPSPPAEISLAELAALDSGEHEVSNRRSGHRAAPSSTSMRTSRPVSEPKLPNSNLQAIIEEDDEEVVGSEGPLRKGVGEELSLKTWIAAGVLIGLSLAIVFFGAMMLIGMTRPPKPPEVAERPPEETSVPEPVAPAVPRPKDPNRSSSPLTAKSKTTKQESVGSAPSTEVVKVTSPPVERAFSTEWETRLFPDRATHVSPIVSRSRILVRRVLEPGEDLQTSSLSAALSRADDLVEIADTGPFFEDNFQISGRTKVVRGREGIRPMIRIDFASNEIVKEQVAKFVLGGTTKTEQLVLEGLDIAVDIRDLPDQQTALFLCQGAELVLRDCTLTVINANDPGRVRRFSIFRVEEGVKPNQIVLERTVIRGPVRTLFDVVAARASIVLDRSVVVGDAGPRNPRQVAPSGRAFPRLDLRACRRNLGGSHDPGTVGLCRRTDDRARLGGRRECVPRVVGMARREPRGDASRGGPREAADDLARFRQFEP